MRKICYIVVAVCILLGCEDTKTSTPTLNESQKTETSKTVEKSTEKKAIKKEKHVRITDDNVLDYMLAYGEENKEQKVRIVTDFGNIDLELYNETPYHRANFIMLAKRNYFEGTQFHRVVKNFIIQGGNSDSWSIAKKRREIGSYLLPPDTKKGFRHDRGLADARLAVQHQRLTFAGVLHLQVLCTRLQLHLAALELKSLREAQRLVLERL